MSCLIEHICKKYDPCYDTYFRYPCRNSISCWLWNGCLCRKVCNTGTYVFSFITMGSNTTSEPTDVIFNTTNVEKISSTFLCGTSPITAGVYGGNLDNNGTLNFNLTSAGSYLFSFDGYLSIVNGDPSLIQSVTVNIIYLQSNGASSPVSQTQFFSSIYLLGVNSTFPLPIERPNQKFTFTIDGPSVTITFILYATITFNSSTSTGPYTLQITGSKTDEPARITVSKIR